MSTEQAADDLLALIKQTQEQLNYFQELGVTGVVIEPFEPAEPGKQATPKSEAAAAPGPSAAELPFVQGPIARANLAAAGDGPGHASPMRSAKQEEPSLSQDSLFGELLPPAQAIAKSTETLEQIWAEVGDCTRCPLHEGRTNIVHTEGSRKARLMFVGEAPGADEDAQARPFVGRAGQLLTKIIESLGLQREEVLIGNVNRCRPPGNRPPTPDEVAMCKPFLLREIASVAPDVIVVLGNTAMKNLLEVKEGITRLRGIFQDYKGIKTMPTFHPAYLLRDPSKKRETWEDLKKVRDYLESTTKKET
jgi:DNA polymerase